MQTRTIHVDIQPMKTGLILLAMLLAMPAAAGVYKWTDAQGRIHYTDSPPPAARATQMKLQTHTGPVEVSRANGAGSGVTIYTTAWCGVCTRAKAFFRKNGIPFTEWDVEKTEYGAIKYGQLGGRGVPVITVGAEKMMGFESGRFMEMWKAAQRTQ
ncbi:MAG: glutaredoxin family protein [Thiobacillus sp.]|nr:glutaredoxin family protein [Thiobacillus sp.]